LSRELGEYRSPSPSARAAAQLAAAGKTVRPGQRVRFLVTRGEPGVHAWDLPLLPDRRTIDYARYQELLLRAAVTVLQPLGLEEAALRLWVHEPAAGQLSFASLLFARSPGLPNITIFHDNSHHRLASN
jgi:DNA polymerase elongation subunit (family B)